ncbi:hypothetical protein DENSPDRAFT_834807 [Dentipellis sp. KUC8613]|nr:hypothetical protein DENSPDRAFT_834807 [Dentipellis sp. KUC8613]
MANTTPALLPKPIIQRSSSVNLEPTASSGSSSPTWSVGPSASGPQSEVHATRSTNSLRNDGSPSPSIVFAPLPVTEPRRRKSNVQLGVAARSRMLAQRRAMREEALRQQQPMWTELDEKAVNGQDREEDMEDPLALFGRYLAGKSKGLWRKVSQKGGREEIESTKGRPRSPPPKPHGANHPLKEPVSSDTDPEESEGRVWEEEISMELQIRLTQRDPNVEPGAAGQDKRTRKEG